MALYGYQPTTKKALWAQMRDSKLPKVDPKARFPALNARQRQRPIRQVSKRQAKRDARYAPIANAYKRAHHFCEICVLRMIVPARPTEHIHHTRGKAGELYFDTRFFKAACFICHRWAHDNMEAARALGLFPPKGGWNERQPVDNPELPGNTETASGQRTSSAIL